MYYSSIVALAIMILTFENHDILFKRSKNIDTKSWNVYRNLLYAIMAYYIVDMFWGVLYFFKLRDLLYIDTLIYFVAMGTSVLFWTLYVTVYINEYNIYATTLKLIGQLFFVAEIIIVVINVFKPILFWIDDKSEYYATSLRHFMLIAQIILLVAVSLFAFSVAMERSDSSRNRYKTIAWFGLIMAIFLTVQLWFPILPLYTVAYMLGTCMLRSFVVNGEKEEYKLGLEQALERENNQLEELKNARVAAYRDSLTGVKSKTAYAEIEKQKNTEIQNGCCSEFAIAVFDLNGLKMINDTYGHEKGDEFIKSGCKHICETFKHSPVFRVGGDEFVVLLEKEDFINREALENKFNEIMESRDGIEEVIVAMGMSDYIPGEDYTLNDVFKRADQKMYIKKSALKNR